jgi:hypothetical protein
VRIRRHVVDACGGLTNLECGQRSQAQKFIIRIRGTIQHN